MTALTELKQGNYKKAQQLYAKMFLDNPRTLAAIVLDYETLIAQEPAKLGARFSLAGFLLSSGEADAAIMELEEIIDTAADTLRDKEVEAYNVLGRIYIHQDRIDDAIALLERSVARGIKDVRLIETLAAAYLERGRTAEALRFYEELLVQKPGNKQILRILGELYTRSEEYVRAAGKYAAMFSDDPEVVREVIQRLEELLKKIEGNIEIREMLANIYMKTLNPEAAVAKLREIIRLEPSKLAEIIGQLKGILKNYPNHPLTVIALSEALVRQGNFSEAAENLHQLFKARPETTADVIKGYREILESCPEQVLARAYLGEAFLAQGQAREALGEFSQMIESDPTVADMVIKQCREIMKVQPQLLEAHVVLGQAYIAKGDFQRAVVEAEGAITIDKNLIPAYILLGEAQTKLGLPQKAAHTLRSALVCDPYNLQIHEKYRLARELEIEVEIEALKKKLLEDQWKLSLHLDLAKLLLEKKEKDPAIRELQLALKDSARAPVAYHLLGNVYRSDGRFDLAAAQYNHALELASAGMEKAVRCKLGTTYEASGEIKKAIKIYESVLQEDIDFGGLKERIRKLKSVTIANMRNRPLLAVIAQYGKKDIIALWGRDQRVAARAGKKEEVNVSFGQDHNREGFELFLKGMYPAAVEELSLAAQLDRRFGSALSNLGVALAKTGKYDEARARLLEAVQADPASAVFYNNLGVIFYLLGNNEQAALYFEKSLALDPESAALCINLGDLCYARKEPQKAIELYRRVGQYDALADIAAARLASKVP